MSTEYIFILLGAFAGGFVSGLTGFGTALSSLAFWLHVIGPATAAPLVIVSSVIAQSQNLSKVWHDLDWRRLLPFLIGGLIGVPIGAQLLTLVDPVIFKMTIGCVLICYSIGMLLLKPRWGTSWGGRPADGMVGLVAGVLGGLAGLSGVLPTIWAVVRGWTKVERRSLFQAFNLTILGSALISYAIAGLLTAEIGRLVLMAAPGTLIGAWTGFFVYKRLSDHSFHVIVLWLLFLAGIMLIVTG